MRYLLCCWLLGLALIACRGAADAPAEEPAPTPAPEATEAPPPDPITLTVTSTAFQEGAAIPAEYTCEGNERVPPLAWTAPPEGTASIAVIVDDPDAPNGTWVHWVVFDLPGDLTALDADAVAALTAGTQANNSWRKVGWGGPCPPKGHGPHRYFFRVYALDTQLGLTPEASRLDVDDAMHGHILGEGVMMGTFERH